MKSSETTANPRILVVEDEGVVAKDIQNTLKSLGYEVSALASSGEEAIEKAAETQPDLILMDIVLQGEMDGVEAVAQIQSVSDIPVVYLTAYADEKTLQRAKITEPYGYILKPFAESGLYSNIEMALYKHKAEQQIRASLQEKEVLLREVNHRARNNLQLVSSLLRHQSATIEDEQALQAFRQSQDRVRSIALVHEQPDQARNWSGIDFAGYIRSLTDTLFLSFGADSDVIRLQIDAEDVPMGVDNGIACALIINELVSNSLKHAFPGGREGEIRIELRSEEDQFVLMVSDNGVGFPEDSDLRTTETLGLELVHTLVDQLEGTIELDRSGGSVFKITFGSLRSAT